MFVKELVNGGWCLNCVELMYFVLFFSFLVMNGLFLFILDNLCLILGIISDVFLKIEVFFCIF